MTTTESALNVEEWIPENQDKDIENESERNNSRSDTENNQLRYDSDENEFFSESEKDNYIFGTDESDFESDRLQSEQGCEKLQDDAVIGSGDGQLETDFTACNRSLKYEMDIRHRLRQGAHCETTLLDLPQTDPAIHDQLHSGYLCVHDNCNDSQKQLANYSNTEIPRITSPAHNAPSHNSIWSWFVFLAPRALCVIGLSFVYLGLAILSIRMLRLSTQQHRGTHD